MRCCQYYFCIYVALLLTNYRCHDSILRLPSNLFFNSTLQVRTNSELHPKTSSALHFVCTSMRSVVVSEEDCSEEEASITLQQVWLSQIRILLFAVKVYAFLYHCISAGTILCQSLARSTVGTKGFIKYLCCNIQ